MACRVGITTNPAGQKQYWESMYPLLGNWELEGPYPTKSEAQAREDILACEHDCDTHEDGTGPECANWYVYYFEY